MKFPNILNIFNFKFKTKRVCDINDVNKIDEFKNNINDKSVTMDKLNLNEIILVDFPDNQYYREDTPKNQIVLHHTVSGRGVEGDIAWWLQTADRIATSQIINWDGKIYQCFSSKYWGHHLGIKQSVFNDYKITKTNNLNLNKSSIGIEIDAWGGLIKYEDKWYPAKWDVKTKRNIANLKTNPIKNVQEYPNGYRGFYGFEKYTDAQIESVRKLLVYWGERYNIPLKYNEAMWDISKDALSGDDGVWTHTSFRADKSDCHPQPELIKMLKKLSE